MHSGSISTIYVYSDDNKLQYYFNNDPMRDYLIPKLYIGNSLYLMILCQLYQYKELSRMARDNNYECYKYISGYRKYFFINCYNIL